MELKRKLREASIWESGIGFLAATVLLCWFCLMDLPHWTQLLLTFPILISFIACLSWFVHTAIHPTSSASPNRTMELNCLETGDRANGKPAAISETVQPVQRVAEPMISETLPNAALNGSQTANPITGTRPAVIEALYPFQRVAEPTISETVAKTALNGFQTANPITGTRLAIVEGPKPAQRIAEPAISETPTKTELNGAQTESPIACTRPVIVEAVKVVAPVPEQTISEKLRKFDGYQFEKLVELIYEHRGVALKRLGEAGPDGGVCLINESSNGKLAVQCKRLPKGNVGVRLIREFCEDLTDAKIKKGIFITLTGYTRAAKQLADKHGIQTLEEGDIIEMLKSSGLTNARDISGLFADEMESIPKGDK